ncbi:short-chain dehydrogenase TIC 32, chloroplastic isoform X2 [Selaginella moellendorffii]|uniref:short-chain dehydrogenase TIC 32, chloroplastic isoform X2 n=1 Tax=Selaginella moellendorffii TaxID=88036 RepID=UPI000D1C3C2A|nr:short-chain dehydrogenase TIC 32, chloroplastic isoform X2 [Selaginella moellendorffii]|eukprot:XP_024543898.1 short-chain dehydrogenase TIC 32, chloroplastic isoform X2 [Selaginella moellendorffii]
MALFDGRATAVEVMDGIRLDSKVAIVTGANGGIGFETVRALAIKGAHVILACRNLKSAEAAKASILREEPDVQLTVLRLDLSSLASVREFVEEFKSLKLPLHILINNAGLASSEFMLTVDNLEVTFATNHVGHFLLTNLLLDLMISTALESNSEGRIVIVASRQHESARGINFDSLHKKSWLQSLPLVKRQSSHLPRVVLGVRSIQARQRFTREGARTSSQGTGSECNSELFASRSDSHKHCSQLLQARRVYV